MAAFDRSDRRYKVWHETATNSMANLFGSIDRLIITFLPSLTPAVTAIASIDRRLADLLGWRDDRQDTANARDVHAIAVIQHIRAVFPIANAYDQ